MVALIPLAGLQAVWSADEGALLYQVRALADGEGWTFDHPFPAADPTGTYYPIHLSSWAPSAQTGAEAVGDCSTPGSSCRYIALAKHASFLWVSAGLYSLGGYGMLVLLSVLGGLATALATSRLAALVEPAAEAPALWITALASPILMHSYVAWGHTVAAALIAWAAHGVLAARDSGGRRNGKGSVTTPRTALALVALFLACLVRTEAPLAAFAIGLALLPRRRPVGLSVIATAAAGLMVDRLTATATGGAVEPASSNQRFGTVLDFAAGRIEAFTITWLQPAYGSNPIDLLILAAAAFVLTAAVLTRRGPATATAAQVLLGLAVVALLARSAVSSAALIPGLVAAFPVLFAGLLLVDRKMLAVEPVGELLGGFLLFCGAVLATQYRHGGGGEWGGRYFAVGLPLGVAVASAGMVRAGSRLDRGHRRRAGGLVVATMVVTSTLGVLGLRTVRQETEQLADEIAVAVNHLTLGPTSESGGEAASGGNRGTETAIKDDRPVILSSIPGLGRWMWADLDQARWLRVPSHDLPSTAERLRGLGVERLAFVSARPGTESELLAPWFQLDLAWAPQAPQGEGPKVLVMHSPESN